MRSLAKSCWLLAAVCLLLHPGGKAFAQERVALVIGNGKYANSTPLPNPPSDARAVAKALSEIGFVVSQGVDLDKTAMEMLLRDFLRKASSAKVALLFYAGHGMQVDSRNYLIPVDAKLESSSDLNFGTIELDKILASLDDPKRATIVILDACRDNPMARSFGTRMGGSTRSVAVGAGLAGYSALGSGTLIAFATAPGAVALDGTGSNSPFTLGLIKHLKTPGLEVRQMLTRVRADVAVATNDKQVPWDNSSLRGDVYLAGLPSPPPSTANPDEVRAMQQKLIEMEVKLRARDDPNIAAVSPAIAATAVPMKPVAPQPVSPPQIAAPPSANSGPAATTSPSSELSKSPGKSPFDAPQGSYDPFAQSAALNPPKQSQPSATTLPVRHVRDLVLADHGVPSATFLPDSRTVLSMSEDDGLIKWDAESGARLREWPLLRHSFPRIQSTPDGAWLVVKSYSSLHVYKDFADKTSNPKIAWQVEGKIEDKDCYGDALAVPAKGNLLAAGWTRSTLRLYDLKSGKVVRSLSDGKPSDCLPKAITFSPDAKLIFSSSSRLWNAGDGMLAKARGSINSSATIDPPILDVAFADNGRQVATISKKQLVLLNLETGNPAWTVDYPGWCDSGALAYPNSRFVIAVCGDMLRVYDASSGELLQSVRTENKISNLDSLTVSPDRQRMMSMHRGGIVGVWEIAEPQVSFRNQ